MRNSINDTSTLVTILALLVSLFAQMQATSLLGITIPLSLANNDISEHLLDLVLSQYLQLYFIA
jgi:hypothetical protein